MRLFHYPETQKGHNYLRCTKRKNPCSAKILLVEEIITSEIQKEIQKFLCQTIGSNWMIAENAKRSAIGSPIVYAFFVDSAKADISLLDSKIGS